MFINAAILIIRSNKTAFSCGTLKVSLALRIRRRALPSALDCQLTASRGSASDFSAWYRGLWTQIYTPEVNGFWLRVFGEWHASSISSIFCSGSTRIHPHEAIAIPFGICRCLAFESFGSPGRMTGGLSCTNERESAISP